MESKIDMQTRDVIKQITELSRYRQIVPFIGSGISYSTGFPTIVPIVHYLCKVDFAIRVGLYKDRFPPLKNSSQANIDLAEHYGRHPSQYIRDFGWPQLGSLDADLWSWLDTEKADLRNSLPKADELIKDFEELQDRDHLLAIVQWVLRREQEQRDEGTANGILQEWKNWKLMRQNKPFESPEPKLLYGSWEMLLDKLCEGDFGLADRLFSEFEKGLVPAQSHRLLAMLQSKLGIPLVLTTNFDSFLETAFEEEGLKPKVFHIHRNAELPDPILVQRELSILKLHGSSYGLRMGERLRQKLEIEAKSYIKSYLPKNALLLVIGFSGSERRMMELLQTVVDDQDPDYEGPRIIWLQGPGNPGPLYDELTRRDMEKKSNLVISCRIRQSDAFLQELYFNISGSHQASSESYLSQPTQYLTEIPLKFPTTNDKSTDGNPDLFPLQVFIADQKSKALSTSWATMAGMAYTQLEIIRPYRVIWIDLENHCKVESIVAEFFNRISQVDPKSPIFNFSIPKFEMKEKEEKETLLIKAMSKVVDRMCDIFARGRYVLVLDSLESFGRPPMVHHGIPNISRGRRSNTTADAKNEEDSLKSPLEDFKNEVDSLKSFIESLKDKALSYRDSFVVITIDKPRSRHRFEESGSPEVNNNAAYKHLTDALEVMIEGLQDKEDKEGKGKRRSIRLFKQKQDDNDLYKAFLLEKKYIPNNHDLPTNPIAKLEDNWKQPTPDFNRSLNRATHIYFLIKLFRISTCQSVDDKQIIGSISALVGLLSFFRKPRSIALRHATFDRWVLRKILGHQLNEEQTADAHRVLEHVLDLLTLKQSTLANYAHPECLKSDGGTFKESKIGHKLIKIWKSDDAIGIVGQRHEGGTIWLFRETHESAYCAITEFLHLKEWLNTWKEESPSPNYKGVPTIAPLLDGISAISWHLHIARTYFVDIFLPTRDINAFFEYIYHRVSALRMITLLIAILKKGNGIEENGCLEKLQQLKTESGLVNKLDKDFANPLIWFADVIGVFAESPEYKSNDYTEHNTSEKIKDFLQKNLITLWRNALKTLLMALERNGSFFQANAIPEIIITWASHFLKREMPEITGEEFSEIIDFKLIFDGHDDQSNIELLNKYFENLLHDAYLSKLDAEHYLEVYSSKPSVPTDVPQNNPARSQDANNPSNETGSHIDEHLDLTEFSLWGALIKFIPFRARQAHHGRKQPFTARPELGEGFIQKFLKGSTDSKQETYISEQSNQAELARKTRSIRSQIYIDTRKAYLDSFKLSKLDQHIEENRPAIRDGNALAAKSILANWCVWEPLRKRESLINNTDSKSNSGPTSLSGAETHAIAYEDCLRLLCRTREEDSLHRSDAFTIRARTLYLREHYQLAHRFLDLASSGLLHDRFEHRKNSAVIHIVRAELLATSADTHYRNLIKGSHAETKLLHEALASLKKIERAEQELKMAEALLTGSSHQRNWLIYLEFGKAQVTLETMLFELESLMLQRRLETIENSNLTNEEYLRRSGILEQNILYCMGRIRRVLDLIPFRKELWEETYKKIKIGTDNEAESKLPMLITIERMCYALWSDIFIIGAYTNSMLNIIFDAARFLNKDVERSKPIAAILGTIYEPSNIQHYIQRWKKWSYSMRFEYMSTCVDLTISLNPSQKDNGKGEIITRSLREKILDDMSFATSEEKINLIWDGRRKGQDL